MIDPDKVPEVIRILNESCGANIGSRDTYAFKHYVTTTRTPDYIEWRFQGALGFGGKFRQNNNHDQMPYVDCYREDETPERMAMIKNANDRLVVLFAPPKEGEGQ